MYKYRFNNKVYFASGFHEAKKQTGLALLEGINPIDYFIVRIWSWDEMMKDYSIQVLDAPGHQVFKDYDDALTCFIALKIDYPVKIAEEVKLELVQYHRGRASTLQSRILFPAALAKEP
jgi:hypothetical protein